MTISAPYGSNSAAALNEDMANNTRLLFRHKSSKNIAMADSGNLDDRR
jgi:hypothetical protein